MSRYGLVLWVPQALWHVTGIQVGTRLKGHGGGVDTSPGRGGGPASPFGVVRGSRNLGRDGRPGAYVGLRHDEGPDDGWQPTWAAYGLWRPSPSTQVTGFVPEAGSGSSGTAAYLWASSTSNRGYFGRLRSYVSPDYHLGTDS